MRTISAAIVAFLTLFAGTSACGGGGTDHRRPTASSATPTTLSGDNLGRVVALGEEFLLADVLALGIKPVASTATVVEAGFQGLGGLDITGIEAVSGSEPNLERLAEFQPDTILAPAHVLAAVSRSQLEALARVIEVPTGTGREQLTKLGSLLGRQVQASQLVARLDAALAKATDTVADGCQISVATVYPGPRLAVWVDAPNNVAMAVRDLGCSLVPSTDDVDPDGADRVYLSLEEVGRLSAPKLVLLQSSLVDGESAGLQQIRANELWQQLPAVRAGAVTTLDRLGYPGVSGLIRLYSELAALAA